MCQDHSGVLVEISTASARGPDGKMRGIDACIAPLVKALNDATDGRELLIVPDYPTKVIAP